MKAMKPIFRTKQYIKYGFVKMEHEYCCCPKCRIISQNFATDADRHLISQIQNGKRINGLDF